MRQCRRREHVESLWNRGTERERDIFLFDTRQDSLWYVKVLSNFFKCLTFQSCLKPSVPSPIFNVISFVCFRSLPIYPYLHEVLITINQINSFFLLIRSHHFIRFFVTIVLFKVFLFNRLNEQQAHQELCDPVPHIQGQLLVVLL